MVGAAWIQGHRSGSPIERESPGSHRQWMSTADESSQIHLPCRDGQYESLRQIVQGSFSHRNAWYPGETRTVSLGYPALQADSYSSSTPRGNTTLESCWVYEICWTFVPLCIDCAVTRPLPTGKISYLKLKELDLGELVGYWVIELHKDLETSSRYAWLQERDDGHCQSATTGAMDKVSLGMIYCRSSATNRNPIRSTIRCSCPRLIVALSLLNFNKEIPKDIRHKHLCNSIVSTS